MRALICLFSLAVSGCSTVQSLRDDPPFVERSTAKSLAAVQGCIANATARQDVQFLPKQSGATLSAGVTAGASRFVTWVVDINDTGADRRVAVHATKANSKLVMPAVNSCL
jgi:hypothetical protein